MSGLSVSCPAGRWPCPSLGVCLSMFTQCDGTCFTSSTPGTSFFWCGESGQCLPPRSKCTVLSGDGCGPDSYFCWTGNVCQPRTIPCNFVCPPGYRPTTSGRFVTGLVCLHLGICLTSGSPSRPIRDGHARFPALSHLPPCHWETLIVSDPFQISQNL